MRPESWASGLGCPAPESGTYTTGNGKELRALGSSGSVCMLETPPLSRVGKPVGGPCHGSGER